MSLLREGRARILGDQVNTDYIISSTRKGETIDPHELKRWLLESLDPSFAASVRPGDVLVAGHGFGCGSAMEVAVTVVLAAGIQVVLARSFSRTYFRNAVNNGLVPVECDTSAVDEGHALRIEVSPERTEVLVNNAASPIVAAPMAPFVLDILEAGGLVPYLRRGAPTPFHGTPR